jgi:selenocysteine-specific elongation factor
MPVIATAGHVDHGKSTLVRALTGRDPDRWEEEKRRGLTIDLGFAWATLGDREIGFIDVPGHTRFIKNMLAGVDGADAALFVVAADERWKPQSEEHLGVLDLLGTSPGVIALTRADLVDADHLELAAVAVAERLDGTTLAGSEIVPTAAPTGVGVDRLRAALTTMVAGLEPLDRDRPRLWIDRAFTVEGAGTVVTGTLVDGAIKVGDTLALYPGEIPVRVRGLQVHERSVDEVGPGNRTAINLSGADRSLIERGTMLGRPGEWRATRRMVATLDPMRGHEPIRGDRGSFHLHAGSGSWPARVRSVADGVVLVDLDGEVPLRAGDRYILREVGRGAITGGGRVLDPRPVGRTRAVRSTLGHLAQDVATADDAASRLLAVRGIAAVADLAADTGGGSPDEAVITGKLAVSPETHRAISRRAVERVGAFHEENPFKPGMPRTALARELGLGADTLDAIIATVGGVVVDGAAVRLADHRPAAAATDDPGWGKARADLDAAGAAPPRADELGLHPDAVRALIASGDLIPVGPFAYLPETIDSLLETVAALPGGFTVGDFRDTLVITRKHAIPLLEWLDDRGITRRVGDGRVVRR